ncbi:MAG: SDR family oxidoreductase [Rhodospirillales bacterium]|nr:SDR family oxidoreductase [Rhodospirillales bacterium]MDP6805965.1 SDR family oxidoreductase [Rhodospirillales bacterium]
MTGGAAGIGLGIAEALAARGDAVTIADKDAETGARAADAIAARGLEARFVHLDVTDVAAAADVIREIDSRTPLGVVVNNAGILMSAPLVDVTPEDYDALMGVNVRALFFVMQAAARLMAPRRMGCIVNVSSTAGIRPATILPQSVYGASKAAVAMLTLAAARELAPLGIRVNGVAPSTIDTPMVRTMASDEALGNHVRTMVPIGRLGTPGDVAEAVAFLTSAKASYIVGHTIVVDGGKLT